jgi:hypothetical protein
MGTTLMHQASARKQQGGGLACATYRGQESYRREGREEIMYRGEKNEAQGREGTAG